MPTQTQAEDVLDSFDSILQVWTDNPDFKIGKFDLAAAQNLNQKSMPTWPS